MNDERYFQQIKMDIEEMEICTDIYHSKISPNLSRDEKIQLKQDLFNYVCEQEELVDWKPLGDNNPVSTFPLLNEYWFKDYLSALEIYVLMDCLQKDL